jgi:hypothetical protein
MRLKLNQCAIFYSTRCFLTMLFLLMCLKSHSQDTDKVYLRSLPDPLVMIDGTPVTSVKQWETKRRPEILKLFTTQMYGQSPGRPANMKFKVFDTDAKAFGGLATRRQVTVFFNGTAKGPKMDILIYLPNQVKHRVPVFLGLNFHGNQAVDSDKAIHISDSWMGPKDRGVVNNRATEITRGEDSPQWPIKMLLKRGYGIATVYAGDITPDNAKSQPAGVLAMYPQLQQQGDNFSAIAAWAWGLSRAMDYLETDPGVDASKVIVTGTSRMGKASVWAGATDRRFAIVISNESGAGGAKLFHHWEAENVERLCKVFPHWFCHNFQHYIGKDTTMAFDQHMVLALVAPRPLYVASAKGSEITDSYGEFLSAKYAAPVYKLFHTSGLPTQKWPDVDRPVFGQIGYHMRSGKHDILPYDWEQFMNFADLHFNKKN